MGGLKPYCFTATTCFWWRFRLMLARSYLMSEKTWMFPMLTPTKPQGEISVILYTSVCFPFSVNMSKGYICIIYIIHLTMLITAINYINRRSLPTTDSIKLCSSGAKPFGASLRRPSFYHYLNIFLMMFSLCLHMPERHNLWFHNVLQRPK